MPGLINRITNFFFSTSNKPKDSQTARNSDRNVSEARNSDRNVSEARNSDRNVSETRNSDRNVSETQPQTVFTDTPQSSKGDNTNIPFKASSYPDKTLDGKPLSRQNSHQQPTAPPDSRSYSCFNPPLEATAPPLSIQTHNRLYPSLSEYRLEPTAPDLSYSSIAIINQETYEQASASPIKSIILRASEKPSDLPDSIIPLFSKLFPFNLNGSAVAQPIYNYKDIKELEKNIIAGLQQPNNDTCTKDTEKSQKIEQHNNMYLYHLQIEDLCSQLIADGNIYCDVHTTKKIIKSINPELKLNNKELVSNFTTAIRDNITKNMKDYQDKYQKILDFLEVHEDLKADMINNNNYISEIILPSSIIKHEIIIIINKQKTNEILLLSSFTGLVELNIDQASSLLATLMKLFS